MEFPFGEESTLKATPDKGTEMIEAEEATTPQYSIARDRSRRPIKPPQRFAEADMVAYALNVAEDIDAGEEPSTYNEAISCVDSEKWLIAMNEEM